MSVITFASLKGGVGKTSLSINIAHSFAFRGCMTLLIDLDPSGHATRLFKSGAKHTFPETAPLARLLLNHRSNKNDTTKNPEDAHYVLPVRKLFEILPGGKELRYFTPAQGAKYFAKRFPLLLEELKTHFDHIVIDTPPEFNVLTRTAIAQSNLVVAPLDASEMGIHSVEELLEYSRHLKSPNWALVRTMVNSKAARTKVLSNSRLEANIIFSNSLNNSHDTASSYLQDIGTDHDSFVSMFKKWGPINENGNANNTTQKLNGNSHKSTVNENKSRTIFLLDSVVNRTEVQNQLTFLSRTAFDSKKTTALARQYLAVAREIEDILSGMEEDSNDELPTISHKLTEVRQASNGY